MANFSQNQIPNEPMLKDLLDLFQKQIALGLNCHAIGVVQGFDPAKQVASATIAYKKTFFQFNPSTNGYDPVLNDYPILVDCPVICLGGGSAALTFPIAKGDECLVLFNDRDLDNWFQGGSGGGVATPRLHSFSDGLILVGVRSLANVIEDYDTTRAVLRNGNAMVGVGPELIKIANEVKTLKQVLEGLTAKIDNVLTTGTVASAPGPVTFSGSVASYNPTIGELLE